MRQARTVPGRFFLKAAGQIAVRAQDGPFAAGSAAQRVGRVGTSRKIFASMPAERDGLAVVAFIPGLVPTSTAHLEQEGQHHVGNARDE